MRIAPVAGRGRARNECDVGVSSRDLCIRSTTMSSFFFREKIRNRKRRKRTLSVARGSLTHYQAPNVSVFDMFGNLFGGSGNKSGVKASASAPGA